MNSRVTRSFSRINVTTPDTARHSARVSQQSAAKTKTRTKQTGESTVASARATKARKSKRTSAVSDVNRASSPQLGVSLPATSQKHSKSDRHSSKKSHSSVRQANAVGDESPRGSTRAHSGDESPRRSTRAHTGDKSLRRSTRAHTGDESPRKNTRARTDTEPHEQTTYRFINAHDKRKKATNKHQSANVNEVGSHCCNFSIRRLLDCKCFS